MMLVIIPFGVEPTFFKVIASNGNSCQQGNEAWYPTLFSERGQGKRNLIGKVSRWLASPPTVLRHGEEGSSTNENSNGSLRQYSLVAASRSAQVEAPSY
jgi:hypothetical protein